MQLLIVGSPSPTRDQLVADLDTQGLKPEPVNSVADAVSIGSGNGFSAVLLLLDRPDTMNADLAKLRERIGDPMMVVLPPVDADTGEPVTSGGGTATATEPTGTLVVDDPHMLAQALDAGADDAIRSPYDQEVLFARVRALVRRCNGGSDTTLKFEDLELNYAAHTVTRAGQAIKLTAKEFDLLTLFMTQPRRVLSREDIGKHAWDRNFDAFSNVIEVIVSRLRKKIDQPFDVPYLHTVVGRGYMMSVTPPTE